MLVLSSSTLLTTSSVEVLARRKPATLCLLWNPQKNLRLLGVLFVLSLLLSAPSIVLIPRYLPFLDSEVRAAAPHALEKLRSHGLWLINIEMQSTERRDGEICFTWEHRYRARERIEDPEILTTCADA